LYASLARLLATDARAAEIVGEPRWDTPLRLLGGLHYLVLDGRASWEDVEAALSEHGDFLARFVAEQPVQTNEVQRSWGLLPCFLLLAARTGARIFDLIELGPSAGLNLVWDRYRYRYVAGTWGRREASLELGGDERRAIPAALLQEQPHVRGRVGIDLDPVDVTTEEGTRLLRSFVWADQTERLDRLDRAIAALRQDPPLLLRGDLVELLPRLLQQRRDDALTVVFETATLAYVSQEGRAAVRAALSSAGREGPLAVVSTGRQSDADVEAYGLHVTLWPGGEREEVGVLDYHAAWLDWIAG
jgi:hypothetical protein